MMTIPTLTLTQPYASLIGAKRIETRSWPLRHRGELAIHAAQSLAPIGGVAGLVALVRRPRFRQALAVLHPLVHEDPSYWLPRGQIVRIVAVTDCVQFTATDMISIHDGRRYELPDPDSDERQFGDFTAGRFGILLDAVRVLRYPVEARGARRLWLWMPTVDLSDPDVLLPYPQE